MKYIKTLIMDNKKESLLAKKKTSSEIDNIFKIYNNKYLTSDVITDYNLKLSLGLIGDGEITISNDGMVYTETVDNNVLTVNGKISDFYYMGCGFVYELNIKPIVSDTDTDISKELSYKSSNTICKNINIISNVCNDILNNLLG